MSELIRGRSLVDDPNQEVIDIWVVFMDLDRNRLGFARSPFWQLLEPGFRHVEIWRRVADNAWVRFGTSSEFVRVDVTGDAPWKALADVNPLAMRVQRVVTKGKMREPFFIGPVTCVELAKAFLGVRGFFIRTPFQLYNFLKRGSNG